MAETSPSTPGPAAPLWRHGDFMKLWVAQTISVFGTGFTQLALPLIAVTALGATPAQMGFLGTAEFLPFLLLGLVAGVWVDRWPRRPVLIVGDVGRALALATIPLAALAGVLGMPQLYVVGFLAGVLTVFFDVAYQAYLPALVKRRQLVEGNSRLEASRSIAQVSSPGIAGVVIQIFSAPVAIVLDAISYLASALLIGRIGQPEGRPDPSGRRLMVAEVREGLGVVFGSRLLRSIAGCTGTSNFFSHVWGVLIILFAVRELSLTAATIGVVFSVGNVGALLGAFVAGRVGRRLGVGPTIILTSLGAALGFAPLVFATPRTAVPLLIAGGLISGFSNVVYNVTQVSLRQAITPQRLQGRMNATMRFVVWGTIPLGSLAGGVLGELLGLRPAITVGVAGGLLAFVWVFFSPVRSLRRMPEPIEE
ncbi:MAG TPA: MFS transporter [bacterium]|jgi:MFS family permease|nr:MFS transporter [bacterium]